MARARFVSRYGNYSVGVRHRIAEHYGTGEEKVLQRRLDADFERNIVTDEDLAVAVSTFHFPGLPEDFDTNTNISPRYRVSVWDSEYAREVQGLSDEDVDLCISSLREDMNNGSEFVEVTVQPMSAPFPTYDDLTNVDEILAVVRIAGLDPEVVAAYEAENQNRESVLNALRGVEADDDVIVVNAG